MNIKPIKSEADYDAALAAIDRLVGAAPDAPESDELEILVTLVETYEAVGWPAETPDPVFVAPRIPRDSESGLSCAV